MEELKVVIRLREKKEILYEGYSQAFADAIYRAAIRAAAYGDGFRGAIVSYLIDGLEIKSYIPIDYPKEKLGESQ